MTGSLIIICLFAVLVYQRCNKFTKGVIGLQKVPFVMQNPFRANCHPMAQI